MLEAALFTVVAESYCQSNSSDKPKVHYLPSTKQQFAMKFAGEQSEGAKEPDIFSQDLLETKKELVLNG